MLDPATGSNRAGSLFDIRGARAFHQGLVPDPDAVGVRAQDDLTLVVDLEAPTGYLLHLLVNAYPVPRHAVQRWGPAWAEPETIVSNGPFTLSAWHRREALVLERNPLYHGRFTGNLERVELSLRAAGEWRPALLAYEADRHDLFCLEPAAPREMDHVRQRHGAEYVSLPSAAVDRLAFDLTCPPFEDRRVRRAFAHAVDRQALADAALGGYNFPATGGFVPPGMPGYAPGIALPFDPGQAAALLAAAGYPGGRGFPDVELVANFRYGGVCEHLQAQWREHLGVEIRWRVMDWSDLLDLLAEAVPPLLLQGWVADYPDPDTYLRVAVQLHAAWGSERYLDLVEGARRSTDQSERMALYAQAERLLAEDVPLLPLVYERIHMLIKPWVRRYPISVLGDPFWKDAVIEPH
jgi:oligopeptide transport system substrate-binding protein